MKFSEPLNPEDHAAADKEHRRIAQGQKDKLRAVAEAVLRGDDLPAIDRELVAGALRFVADGIPLERPGPKRTKKVPEEARLLYAMHLKEGMSANAAQQRVAREYQCSEDYIKRFLGYTGKDPETQRRAKAKTAQAMKFIGSVEVVTKNSE